MRQVAGQIFRNVLLFVVVPVVYWAALLIIAGNRPIGPAAWNLLVLFALVGSPGIIIGVCLLQCFSKQKPFHWLAIAGFSFVMISVSLYLASCFGAAIPDSHSGR